MATEKDVKKALIELKESMLKAQLKALKELKKEDGQTEQEVADKGLSQVNMVYNILKVKGRPLHINEIIMIAKEMYDINISRESIVSSLIKKVYASDKFIKTGKNTFGLIEDKARYTLEENGGVE